MLKLSHALRSTVSGTMVALVASLSFAPMTWASEGLADTPNKVSTERLQEIVKYESQFATVGELLSEMAEMGQLNSQEKKSIEGFLESRHFSLETKVTPGSVATQSAHWGSMSLTWQDNGTLKTQSGRILHTNASDAKDKIFIDTFNALTAHDISANWTRLLLPAANADQRVQNPLDVLGAVLLGFTRTIASAVADLAIFACGIPVAADLGLYFLRRAIYNGKVTCVNGRYAVTGYEDFRHQFGQGMLEGYNKLPQEHITLSKDFDLMTYSICAPIGHALTGNYNSRVQYTEMDHKLAASVFHGRPPVCTPETADFATKELRRRNRIAEQTLKGQAAPQHAQHNSWNQQNPMVQ
jgi:hypothetical protein